MRLRWSAWVSVSARGGAVAVALIACSSANSDTASGDATAPKEHEPPVSGGAGTANGGTGNGASASAGTGSRPSAAAGASGGISLVSAAGSSGTGSGTNGCPHGEGATAKFSFFVTSLAGLRRLSGSENGFGGDLRFGHSDGLSGADAICTRLAEDAYTGAGCKTWRAFLSVTKGPDGNPVHARDRIGAGPWYDRAGRVVAMTRDNLLQRWPVGADPAIMYDLPNEHGVPNHDPDGTGKVDNHNTITGTDSQGMLYSPDWAFTCHDWTSAVGTDGAPLIGFSWRGGAASFPGSGWFFSAGGTEGGCAPIINLTDAMDFSIRGIGARGGYGGFYCLALEP